ncbi:hypothetical protein BGW38_010117 [Lunasporangiospora selenospora]|uniref:Uncharacterized protein n=1 Tax=Lunasporangiospora selenospora TaxID=979761 RepID=A0A9P6KFV7_9FUNG|nr:hypothetical protein BGW38_010117 [Lunasporangiospora selenospora]
MKLALVPIITLAIATASCNDLASANSPLSTKQAPVDVTLFVMSRCPDAMKCERTFGEVFKAEDLPPVNLELSYIGAIDQTTTYQTRFDSGVQKGDLVSTSSSLTSQATTVTTVSCKHGPEECAGNTQQLCFKKYFPDHHVWFSFVAAMNQRPFMIGNPSYAIRIGETVLREKGLWNDDNQSLLMQSIHCSGGKEGFDLLVASVQRTVDKSVTTSCTVFIDHKKRCVVDGGVWRECPEGFQVADFVRSIKKAAKDFFWG